MRQALSALFGAGFTVAVSLTLGSLLMRRLRIELRRTEAALCAFLAGAACLSFLVFLLACGRQARAAVFLPGGAAVIGCSVWTSRASGRRRELPAISLAWSWLFAVTYSAYFLIYLVNALAPEVSPDGAGYHLGNVARMWVAHGFVWSYHSMYSYLSEGMEMLFLAAFSFGRHSAAALTHFAFQAALPIMMVCYGRRMGFPRAAVFAAILTYASPVTGLDGSSAYTDVALATVSFAVFYLLQVWDEQSGDNLLVVTGLLSGFAYAIKYTGWVVPAFAAAFVGWRSWRRPAAHPRYKSWLAFLLPASAMMAPWILRNWFWVGNPVAPFFNGLFPNSYFHQGVEQSYVENLRRYAGIAHAWEIPLQLTLFGGSTEGLVGPAFLLAPLALLSLRFSAGRRLLAAALFFAAPAYWNTGCRFWIPCLPAVALAMGIAMERTRGALPAVAVFQAVVCWPAALSTYCDPWAWRISEIPVQAALRKEPEEAFLVRRVPELALRPAIEAAVPPGGRVFSFTTMPEAYIGRVIVVSYESALGNFANDTLLTPVEGSAPTHCQSFRFAPVAVRGVRVVQTAAAGSFWSVAEMRVSYEGRELPLAPWWRASARPNPWEAYLALDGNQATRWSTWQAMSPGDRLQIEFGRAERIDEVALRSARQWAVRLRLELLSAGGTWVAAAGPPEEWDVPPPPELRKDATRALRERGIGFLLVRDADAPAKDMRTDPARWGLTELASSHGIRLYRID